MSEVKESVQDRELTAQEHFDIGRAKFQSVYETEKGWEHMRKAAELGHTTAQYIMGSALYHGELTAVVEKDTDKALEFLLEAALKGESCAIEEITALYLTDPRLRGKEDDIKVIMQLGEKYLAVTEVTRKNRFRLKAIRENIWKIQDFFEDSKEL